MDKRPTLNLPKSELGKLALLLQIARMQFDPQHEDHGRAGVRNALIGVIHYVSTVIPGGEELVLPLNQLLYGLKSLDQGTVVPLLERAKVTGRPPEALASDLFQAMAAALMDLYLQANFSRDVAASVAARKLNRHGYRHKEDQKITASQVENWRDKMRAEKGSDDRAGARYRSTLDDLQTRFPNSPREAAKHLLDCLPELCPPQIPQNPPS